ncbi:YVTN family beta-propeller repeat protein [Leeia oryzae]|uniref:YVTN family beta-propeller repeat protein n=1 Tax=Leeia oryzae TaxID=356662 RepID=UPI00039F6214|nr:YncE family protein [Leeia oryzae]
MLKIMKSIGLMLGIAGSSLLAAPSGTAYTANERDATISQVALATGQVKQISLTIAPHNVQISPDGQWLLAVGMPPATGMHAGMAGMGQLQVFQTGQMGAPAFVLPAGNHPAHVVTDLSGQRAFVTDSAANAVLVYDLASRKQTGRIPTGAYPHGLRLSPAGDQLFVANMQDNSVSVISVASLTEVARIPVGRAPVQVGFSPDGKRVYVSLSGEDALGVIDTRTRKLVARIPVGHVPVQMQASPDNRQVFVANQGNKARPNDTVSVIDPATQQVKVTVTTGKGAHGVALADQGAYVLVTNMDAGTLSVIDATSLQVVATYPVGAGPNGITWQAGQTP